MHRTIVWLGVLFGAASEYAGYRGDAWGALFGFAFGAVLVVAGWLSGALEPSEASESPRVAPEPPKGPELPVKVDRPF